jgi:hypothetical protein
MRPRKCNWGRLLFLWILLAAPGVSQPVGATETSSKPTRIGHPIHLANTRELKSSSSGPQPTIIIPTALSSAPTILLGINFGEKVTATDPSSLYSLSCSNCPPGSTGDGTSKVDSLLDVNKGLLFLSIQVANPKSSAVLQVSVPAGVTTNVAGQPNTAAQASVSYIPSSSGAAAVGKSMAIMFQAAFPASIVASAAGVIAPSVVADISNRALMTTLIGGIAIPAMPPIYSSFSAPLEFVKLDAA